MKDSIGKRAALAMATRSCGWFALLGVLATSACGSLLDVDPPDRVPEEQLRNPSTATLQVESLIASFDCAFAQYIVTTGEVSDELVNSNLASSQAFEFDARSVGPDNENYAIFECEQYNAIYLPLTMMLQQSAETLELLNGWSDEEVPDRSRLIATTLAYDGYGRVLLGESFCTAAIGLGEELPSAAILQEGENRLSQAIEMAEQVGAEEIAIFARVGRARVRRDLGDVSGALADARLIPEEFVYNSQYSSASVRSMNHVYRVMNQNLSVSVDPRYRELTYGGVPDPRVPVRNTGQMGSGQVFEVWDQSKYASLAAPIPLATWDEAQLIIAELAGGQEAVEIINMFHDRAGLPAFSSSDEGEIADHVIQERARELFLEGQRFWDVRRFELELSPEPGTPYPKGGFYGDMRCFPLPNAERFNNPNI